MVESNTISYVYSKAAYPNKPGPMPKDARNPWSPCCNGRVVVAVTLVLVVLVVLVVETMILFRACRHYCLSRGGAVSKCRLLFVIVNIVHHTRGSILHPSMLTERLPTTRDKKLGPGTRRRLRPAIHTGPAASGACASTWRDKRTMGKASLLVRVRMSDDMGSNGNIQNTRVDSLLTGA
jgi:hypothetical protein